MSRQRLRPSLEEATGYVCPGCHGTGMVRDLRSLSLSIMRKVEEIALRERHGEVQVEVPVEIAAFLLNEKRHSLVYLEQTSSVRVTVLPHPHLETPHYEISNNPEGFAPTSYERTEATRSSEKELGYESSEWHLEEEHPVAAPAQAQNTKQGKKQQNQPQAQQQRQQAPQAQVAQPSSSPCAWLENLFVQKQAVTIDQSRTANNAAAAIENMVNGGAVSRGQFGHVATTSATAQNHAVADTNAYLSSNAVAKSEQRDFSDKNFVEKQTQTVERDEKNQRNNKKRNNKHKESREQSSEQNQVIEEVVQPQSSSRQEQRHEQREQKRQGKQRNDQRQDTRDQQFDGHTEQAVPRRDRNNQQRPNRPNRHRDASVFNNAEQPQNVEPQQATFTEQPQTQQHVAQPQHVKVNVIDAPRHENMATALVVNIDQAQSEIIALAPQATALQSKVHPSTDTPIVEEKAVSKTPTVEAKPTTERAKEKATEQAELHEKKPQAAVQRASNDPRQRRRHQREAAKAKTEAPKIAPSQVPTLGQHTVSSLIRHVYGEDCSVLIEQFGLIPTFNRALQKFTSEYAATLTVSEKTQDVSEKKPVTRDVEVTKAQPEAQPAEVLDLTPPKPESDRRVANDPRERRRLAKQAAEQAKHAQLNTEPVAKEETPAENNTSSVEAEASIEVTAQPDESAQTVNIDENVHIEAPSIESTSVELNPRSEVATEGAIDEKASEQTKAQQTLALDVDSNAKSESESTETKADKATDEKPARPRRPRGRPPKKATPPATE